MRIHAGLFAVLALSLPAAVDAQEAAFKVVVQESLPGASIKRSMVADIFLKKTTRWGDGYPISPVDQSTAAPVRIAFSQQVVGKPVAGVQIYWMRQMSSPGGATPPPVKPSDAEVIAFVESRKGAIGYVSEAAPLPPTLKALELTE
jgi:ABC-type phosphate transport system substrate-binding protein